MSIYIKTLSLLILAASLTMCATAPKKVEEIDVGVCISCHQERTPSLFQSWVESKYAKNGVNCITCHKNHETAKPKKSAVEPEVCGRCHSGKYNQFQMGRHFVSWDRMKEHLQYQALPDPLKKALRMPLTTDSREFETIT